MAKWFDKWMNGNPNKPDFTAKDLPKTRFDLFIDVIKTRFLKLLGVNLLYMLFLLPLIIFSLYFWFATSQELSKLNTDDMQKIMDTIMTTLDGYILTAIPLYMLAGPAKAGMHYVIRNWCWGENAAISADFWKEFKRSWKQSVALHFITGVAIYAAFWWIRFLTYPENAAKYPWMIYAAALIGFLLGLYLISSMFQFPQLVTYSLKVKQIIKNTFIYLVVQLPRNFVAMLCYIAIAALCIFLKEVFIVALLTMGVSFITVGKTIYCNFLFDKYVNKDTVLLRRGMAPLEKGK